MSESARVNVTTHLAHLIASPAMIETIEGYEDGVSAFREHQFTYAPLPQDDKYVNTETETVHELQDDQIIFEDESIFVAIERLQDLPFLLIEFDTKIVRTADGEVRAQSPYQPVEEREKELGNFQQALDAYPEMKEEIVNAASEVAFEIITVADVNRRKTKEALYPVIAELESIFADAIKAEFEGEKQIDIIPNLSYETIQRWGDAREEGLRLHATEFMSLSEMIKIIAKNQVLYEQFGFESRNKFEEGTSGLVDLRNHIMHSSRTLVHKREDLSRLVGRIERAKKLIEMKGTTVELRNYPLTSDLD